MKQTKVDSVQNFLTPSKLLSSLMGNNKKNKFIPPVQEPLSSPSHADDTIKTWGGPGSPRKEPQSYKQNKANNSLGQSAFKNVNKKPTYQVNQSENNRSLESPNNSRARQEVQNKERSAKNSFLIEQSRDVVNQSIDFSESRLSKNSLDGNNARYKPVGDYSKNHTRSEVYPRPKQSPVIQKVEQKKTNIGSVKKNPEISQLQIRDLMQKLVSIRNELEEQIAELKHTLDNTSNYLESIDIEYEKIKQKILIFTSRALDASFNDYKKNLPDWGKYESVEENSLSKLIEINQTLQAYEKMDIDSTNFGSTFQMQKKMENYKHLIGEVKDARAECFSRRPKIPQQRLRKFQSAVWDLGKL